MNAEEFKQYLESIGACDDAIEWANGKSWKEVYHSCHRGDWLLWLYRRSKGYDLKKIALAKGLCANTVRHLMNDERSVKAVDAAISYGQGNLTKHELDAAADAAYAARAAAAYYAADAAYAAAAAYAARAARAAAAAAADAADAAAAAYAAAAYSAAAADAADAAAAAYAADAAFAAYAAYAATKKYNQQKTADIVRDALPFEVWQF